MPDLEPAVAAVEQAPEPAQGPQPGEDFFAAMKRHGWSEDGPPKDGEPGYEAEPKAEVESEADTSEPTEDQVEEPEKEEATADGDTETDTEPTAKRTEIENPEVPADLRELAKKYGFEIEGKRVTGKDWAGFNQARRKREAAFQKREHELKAWADDQNAKLLALKDEITGSVSHAQKIVELANNYDFEGLAQAFGFKDFNDFQEVAGAQLADPNYRRIRAAERKAEEAERIAKERADKFEAEIKEKEQKAQEAARQAGIRTYKTQLAANMAESENPYLVTFSDDPWAIENLFRIQQEHYDPATQSTVTIEDALDLEVPGTGKTLRQGLDFLINRVHRHIAKLRPQEGKTEQVVNDKQVAKAGKPAKPANQTSPNKQPDGGNAKSIGDMTSEEYDAYMRRKLRAAIEEDAKSGLEF